MVQSEELFGLPQRLGYLAPVRKSCSPRERLSLALGVPGGSVATPAASRSRGAQVPEGQPCSQLDSTAFDVADELEKGFADEGFIAKNVRHPLAQAGKLKRCNIIYQESSDEYHLMSEELELLIRARHKAQERCIDLFCPLESSPQAETCTPAASRSDRRRPAFTMVPSDETDGWMLLQGHCECCAHRPRHLTCEYMGKGQQVAHIRHYRRTIGQDEAPSQARVHCVEVHVPPVLNGTKSAVWCPQWTGKDLGARTPSDFSCRSSSTCGSVSPSRRRQASKTQLHQLLPKEEDEPVTLHTRLPSWDPEVESLVLNFKDRTGLSSSPRNFMLADGCEPDSKIVLQHAQNGKSTWCLDFRHPLSAVQAFAIALSSIEWE